MRALFYLRIAIDQQNHPSLHDMNSQRPARNLRIVSLWAATLVLSACGGGSSSTNIGHETPAEPPVAQEWQWQLPEGWSPPIVPADNPMSTAKVELGRRLFHDTRLSANHTQSCASCHTQASAFTDNRALSRGATGEVHPRNAQPLANVAYNTTLNWAHPDVTTLEQQMRAPLWQVAHRARHQRQQLRRSTCALAC